MSEHFQLQTKKSRYQQSSQQNICDKLSHGTHRRQPSRIPHRISFYFPFIVHFYLSFSSPCFPSFHCSHTRIFCSIISPSFFLSLLGYHSPELLFTQFFILHYQINSLHRSSIHHHTTHLPHHCITISHHRTTITSHHHPTHTSRTSCTVCVRTSGRPPRARWGHSTSECTSPRARTHRDCRWGREGSVCERGTDIFNTFSSFVCSFICLAGWLVS